MCQEWAMSNHAISEFLEEGRHRRSKESVDLRDAVIAEGSGKQTLQLWLAIGSTLLDRQVLSSILQVLLGRVVLKLQRIKCQKPARIFLANGDARLPQQSLFCQI